MIERLRMQHLSFVSLQNLRGALDPKANTVPYGRC